METKERGGQEERCDQKDQMLQKPLDQILSQLSQLLFYLINWCLDNGIIWGHPENAPEIEISLVLLKSKCSAVKFSKVDARLVMIRKTRKWTLLWCVTHLWCLHINLYNFWCSEDKQAFRDNESWKHDNYTHIHGCMYVCVCIYCP